jgi:hypothetical protein
MFGWLASGIDDYLLMNYGETIHDHLLLNESIVSFLG